MLSAGSERLFRISTALFRLFPLKGYGRVQEVGNVMITFFTHTIILFLPNRITHSVTPAN